MGCARPDVCTTAFGVPGRGLCKHPFPWIILPSFACHVAAIDIATNLPSLGQFPPKLLRRSKPRPSAANTGPTWVGFAAHVAEHGPHLPNIHSTLDNERSMTIPLQIVGMQADVGRHRAQSGRRRPDLVEFGSKLPQMWATLDDFGPSSARRDQHWPSRPHLVRVRRISAMCGDGTFYSASSEQCAAQFSKARQFVAKSMQKWRPRGAYRRRRQPRP